MLEGISWNELHKQQARLGIVGNRQGATEEWILRGNKRSYIGKKL
jgi:hypothetical protein